MKREKRILVGAGAMVFCVLPLVARAEIVTFIMEGDVQAVDDAAGWLDFANVGDRVHYAITFDSDTPSTNPGSFYQGFHAISGSAWVGSTELHVSNPGFVVQGPANFFRMVSAVEVDGRQGSAEFDLHYYTAGELSYDHLLTQPYLLSDFQSAMFTFGFTGPVIDPDPYPRWLSITGEIDSFYAIPEPATLLLLAVGAFTVASRRYH